MLTIEELARTLGVSVPTLRHWNKSGRLLSTARTMGNPRRYAEPKTETAAARRNVLYARVSSHDEFEGHPTSSVR